MKKVTLYLVLWLVAIAAFFLFQEIVEMPAWYRTNVLFAKCTGMGILGGLLYCLRAVYVNKSVQKKWDSDWEIWYFLRPVTSAMSGFVSCIFLKAGLLVLDAKAEPNPVDLGYLALAFIAGYNVDRFMKKLESIAFSVWGVEKSRASVDDAGSKKERPESTQSGGNKG